MKMRKKKTAAAGKRSSRGVAILFALSVLSIVLVIVMIFAAKAKVESKTASMHMSNQSARLLAKSLIPRIILTLEKSKECVSFPLFSSSQPFPASGSKLDYDWIWKLEMPGLFKFKPKGEKDGNSNDQFSVIEAGYKLTNGIPEYTPDNLPNWQYIRIPGGANQTGNKILARYAFITIPHIPGLNPNALASHKYCCDIFGDGKEEKVNCSCANKPGVSAAELFFDDSLLPATIINRTGKEEIGEESHTLTKKHKDRGKDWTEAEFLQDCEKPQGANTQAIDDELKKFFKVLPLNDDEALSQEAFWSDDNGDNVKDEDEFYHRFNLRRTDWETITVDKILEPNITRKPPKKYKDQEGFNPKSNFDTGGIAWLANWKDGGDWGDGKTGDEEAKAIASTQCQIAANLINYCSPGDRKVESGTVEVKKDDKGKYYIAKITPIDPSDWKTKKPDYTGLKRTPYLNELFYQFKIQSLVDCIYNESTNRTSVKVRYNLDYTVLVEIVDMYYDTLGLSTEQHKEYCTYQPEIIGSISFEYKNPDPSIEEKDIWQQTDTLTFDLQQHPSYSPPSTNGYFGYADVDNVDYPATPLEYIVDGKVEAEDVHADTAIRNIKIKIDRILLKRKINGEYVDCAFLEFNKEYPSQKVSDTGNITPDFNNAYILQGHFEAEDPRQNLRKEDWPLRLTFEYDGVHPGEPAGTTTRRRRPVVHPNPLPVIAPKPYLVHTMPCKSVTRQGPNSTLFKLVGNVGNRPDDGFELDTDDEGNNGYNVIHYQKKTSNFSTDHREQDYEYTKDPAWRWMGRRKRIGKRDMFISTAFIRHAPMESIWELGAIHRGSQWKTLNLSVSDKDRFSKARDFKDFGGEEYKYGDGPILDQVKMVNDLKVPGKINLIPYSDKDLRNFLLGSLFLDMPYKNERNYVLQHNKGNTINKTDADVGSGNEEVNYKEYVNAIYNAFLQVYKLNKADNRFHRRSDLLAANPKDNGEKDPLWPVVRGKIDDSNTDAMEEQIICRIINHLKVDDTVKDADAILVVQTLNDIGGTAGNSIPIFVDWNNDGLIGSSKGTEVINNREVFSEKENITAQFRAGYRRFSDAGNDGKPFAAPDGGVAEKIRAREGIYDNGADTITGEAKIVIHLSIHKDGKWHVDNFTYAE